MRLTDRFPLPSDTHRVLLVDDAADTGSSLSAAKGLLGTMLSSCEVKTAVITSFGPARAGAGVDFALYEDVLLCSPMSKDSKDYAAALAAYEKVGR